MKKDFKTPNNALAYLMGVYLSDGCIHINSGSFGLSVTDEAFCDEVARALDLVGSKYTLHTRQPRLGGWEKKLKYTLRERAPYKIGLWLEKEFPNGRDHLPNVPDDLVRDLVAGILDGDGSIYHRGDGYQLQVCGYSDYLDDLRDLFERFSVKMYYRPGGMNHNLNFKSFVKAGFYFRMPRKQKLVEEYTKRFMKGEK